MSPVHIGAPKTGSTALWSLINRHSVDLARTGLAIPKFGQGRGAGHAGIRQSLRPSRRFRAQDWKRWAAVREDFAAKITAHDHALLSSERLWNVKPERLLEIDPDLEGAHILVHLRDQRELMHSHYSQKIKGGSTSERPADDLGKGRKSFSFERLCSSWAKVFGEQNGSTTTCRKTG